jgi:D-alanyl-D-alanine carboxypeptidase/D-alanyl-D-alanine-endopeptidase (penicillin-binding protein 4)
MTRRTKTLVAALVAVLALAAGCSDSDDDATGGGGAEESATSGGTVGELPDDAVEIMETEPYAASHWSYLVVDPDSGDVVYSNLADQFIFTASQAKEFTVGTVYDVIGADSTITTPVYATAAPAGGAVDGDLVLVAQGDLALGGRGAADGKFNFATDGVDHVYADAIPGAVLPTDDPLAGLDDLATQVKAAGIDEVRGNVLIDDRLWDSFVAQEGPVSAISVNDNLLDLEATPGEPGEPATIAASPANGLYTVDASVTTSESEDDPAALQVAVDEEAPTVVQVTGTVPPGDPSLTVYRIPDAATWARTLFIEALERAGVAVTADPLAPNDPESLPAADSYADDAEVASIESAPLSESGGMILATSYNTGANTFLCLLAANAGSTECDDGLDSIRELATEAGIAEADLLLVDGQGGDPASATPEAISQWLIWAREQPWGQTFADGLPILGERGSLSRSGTDSPAKGKVIGKTGTTAGVEPGTGRMFISMQGLSGYLDVGTDTPLVFVVAVSNAVFPNVSEGIFQVGGDVAMVAAALQQAQEE